METWLIIVLILSVLIGSGGIGWLVSMLKAPAAARMEAKAMVEAAEETAEATLEAGLKQSLETEKMKLRYEILRRRVEQFDRAVLAFKGIAFEREDSTEARDVGMSPPAAVLLRHRAVAVNLHAGLVCGPDVERQERLKPARESFGESAEELAALEFEMGHRSDPGAWKTYPKKFLDVRVKVEKTLTLLQETVDKLAEHRIGEPT